MTLREGSRHDRGAPLDGIVIADLSRVLAGPYCTMLLADMGATVIKVESVAGDDTRTWMPPAKDGVSTYYLSINRNKKSVALDFRDPDHVAIVHDLFRRADIVVENFLPGSLEKFGLDYGSASELNPALIYLSISGFGTAAGARLPGYDLVVQAVSGLMSMTGDPDGEPFRAGIAVFDVMTGLHGAIGVLAALEQRRRTGRGQQVWVDLLSSALSGLVNHSAGYSAAGVVPMRMGNEHPSVYPYQVLPARDRDVVIACGNDRQWQSLCTALGRPRLAEDPRFSRNAERTANRAALHPMLLDMLAQHTADELFVLLNAAGVPCGPVNTIGEGVELAERLGLRPRVSVGEGDRQVSLIRNPISFSDARLVYDSAPPTIGEQSDQVRDWLNGAIDSI